MFRKIFFYASVTLTVFLLTIITAIAQPGSGGDPLPCDPDATCPIDGWILIFGLIAASSAALYLNRQKKSAAC